MPAFLLGCGVQSALTMAPKTPPNPFMEWFNIDQSVVNRVMSALTTNGADIADLYFQHSRKNSMTLENGVISDAKTDIRQGVGLRVVTGNKCCSESQRAASGYAGSKQLGIERRVVYDECSVV
jgi:TldD protein